MFFYKEQVGPPRKCMVIAEVGNVHDGSLGNCHAYIDAVASAGADAVKFQVHVADAESSDEEGWPKRFRFHPQDKTRRDYWRRMELAEVELFALAAKAHSCGMQFICSVFSVEAVRRCAHLCDWLKIPSGEVNNHALLDAVRKSGRPLILSTGMSTTAEMDAAVTDLQPGDRERLIVMQCTTMYPCPAEHVGMNLAFQQSQNICYLGGLSDHSGTIFPSVVAAYLGAAAVEVHVCWDKRQFGADVQSSLTIDELRHLVRGVRFAEAMRYSPVDKDQMAGSLNDAAVYRVGKQRLPHNVYEALAERD